MRADIRHLGDPGTADFQVDKYPFYLLNRLVSQYNSLIEARLRAIGLDIPFWRVLMILGEQSPRGIGEISETAVINLSTMTRIVQRMALKKLVRCLPRPGDNRVTDVSLTVLGEKSLVPPEKLPRRSMPRPLPVSQEMNSVKPSPRSTGFMTICSHCRWNGA